jgi:LacI family transcriptional regulator
MKKMTIDDIARITGVSKSTVSRVMNGVPGVNKDTKQRIMEIVKALDYKPSSFAQGLATKRTKMLGLILPERGLDQFHLNLVGSVANTVCAYGYRLMLSSVTDDWGYQLVKQNLVDGLFIFDIKVHHDERVRILKELNFPFVTIGGPPGDEEDVAFVDIDNETAGYDAIHHLIQLGHRKIAFIGGPKDLRVGFLRMKGYYDALNDAGIIPDRSIVVHGDYTEKSGYLEMNKLLDTGIGFSAVFAVSDLMAIGALKALRERHIKVPHDISVIGFDNIPMAKYVDPPLTTVKFLTDELGKQAANLLIQIIEGNKPEHYQCVFPTELILRDSTGINNR